MTGISKTCATALLVAASAPCVGSAQAAVDALQPADATAQERLRVRVSPNAGYAPSAVRIQAYVEPASENRELEVVIDSASYYRSSMIALNGAQAARVHNVVFQSVPAGTHEVRVVLRDRGGEVRAILYHQVTLRDKPIDRGLSLVPVPRA